MSHSAPASDHDDLVFRALAETSPDAIITIGADSVIRSVNAATERIFGWPASALVGQPLTMLMPERMRPGPMD